MSMRHEHNHDDDSGGTTVKCPMIMRFHAGHCETILWTGWVAATVSDFVLSAFTIFVISFLYEGLKFCRILLMRREARKAAELLAIERSHQNSDNSLGEYSRAALAAGSNQRDLTYWQKILNKPHVIQSLLNIVQIVISYWLMLIFMLFNYWLCLAVVLGLGLGYFFFGIFNNSPANSECCP